jgi:hypothetical protein
MELTRVATPELTRQWSILGKRMPPPRMGQRQDSPGPSNAAQPRSDALGKRASLTLSLSTEGAPQTNNIERVLKSEAPELPSQRSD